MKESVMSNKTKKLIISAASVGIALIIIITACICNSAKITSYAMYTMMPKELPGEVSKGNITFFVKYNSEPSNKELEDGIKSAFIYSYQEQGGEVVEMDADANYLDGESIVPVSLLFMYKMGENLATIKTVFKWIGLGAALIAIVVGIVIWYRVWSKHENAANEHKKIVNSKKKKK